MSAGRITDETFRGLVFPVVKVRYSGPTDFRGSQWFATCDRGDAQKYRVQMPYRSELPSGAANALPAARACLAKSLAEATVDDYVAIPGSLNADTYAFTFVPANYLNRSESA